MWDTSLATYLYLHSTACNNIFALKFSDTNVDVVGLCQQGQFLVVGERSGNLHLIHVPSQQTLLTKVRYILFHFIFIEIHPFFIVACFSFL